jgi:CheY-like chemotaxis protein
MMKQTFTVIWIEDTPRAMKSQVEAIKDYLTEKNFDANIILDDDGTKFNEAIKASQSIDIVVTDKNLPAPMDGVTVIKTLKQKRRLTDVLFYSAKGFDPDVVRNEHYGFIEIVEGKDIIDHLKKLVDKNLKRCEDIVFLRGMVLSMIIDLELKVNEFFANYFEVPSKTIAHFHSFMLESKYNSLAGKKTTLSKILEENKIKENFKGLVTQISELAEDRNLLAHCKTDPTKKNILVCMGDEQEFDKKRINNILEKVNKASEHLENLIKKYPPKR